MALSFVKVVLPAFFGTSSAIVGGLHLGTVETFESYLKQYCIPKELEIGSDSAWKKAEDALKTQQNDSSENKYPHFKDLKEKIEKNTISNGKILKNACVESYSWIYNSFIVNNKKLLPVIKKYCHITIDSMLESGKKYSSKSDIGNVENKISKENPSSNLTFEFQRIKDSSVKTNEYDNFYKECKRLYDSPFLGKDNNDWKVVQDYCLKEDS